MSSDVSQKLIDAAKEVRRNAYSPYFKVFVGAALLAEDGTIHVGCNVENASGSAIVCAEGNALGGAIAKGHRKFIAVAVVGFDDKLLYPCGVCRQKLSEFMSPTAEVIVADLQGHSKKHTFGELFPTQSRSNPMESFDVIERLVRQGHAFVIVTVIDTVGSTPRKSGTRMVVDQDGTSFGSVGGGALENEATKDAIRVLSEGRSQKKNYDLKNELGMCCGGRVELFFECVQPGDPLLLFGAGHITQPLAAMAKWCGFDVTVIDPRPQLLTLERFPTVDRRLVMPWEDALPDLSFSKRTSVIVCTHDHPTDQRIVEACLPKPSRYFGLIGSRVKAAKTRLRLEAAGFDADAIRHVRCPMGLNLGGQRPGEIAASVLAELIAVRSGRSEPQKSLAGAL